MQITTLNLDWNGVGGGGGPFDTWAEVFESNTRLTDLSLRHNGLDERDSVIISENIRQNETIVRLDLSENPLGPIGGKLMFKLMDTFGASRALLMENCNFDAQSQHCRSFDPVNPQRRSFIHLLLGITFFFLPFARTTARETGLTYPRL